MLITDIFTTDRIFNSNVELVNWAKETAMKVNTYLIITRYLRSRIFDCRLYVSLACEQLTMKKKFLSKGGVLTKLKNVVDNNVLSDIVIVHPTSIAMIRTWLYVLIMDITYKMNKLSVKHCIINSPY
ncbi:hypothetical protein M9H77_25625 [Catharanthus roseus]|uniref:Uncharacterized protein n=1 Tax=Catharanthus roseus TaxID=4058 RepID=A0ACC0A7E1_CATRO|nr:hypothetical protein M9H77_25625 [Catharanthus roseus]